MGKIIINGGRRLNGSIPVHGSKNSVLPILAATLAGSGQSIIENCPSLLDTSAACDILMHLGCRVKREDQAVIIDNNGADENKIPDPLMRKMRSSIMFLGAILARNGSAVISFPGGCELGPRPIDLHIGALRKMGVHISEEGGNLYCRCPHGLIGAEVSLAIPSVGATENVMLAAVRAKGETHIINAAKEPEIEDLQWFLNKMGAKVYGAGSGNIRIVGVEKLTGASHRIIPDRIVAITYILACAAAGGYCKIENINPSHIISVLSELKEMGLDMSVAKDSITVNSNARMKAPRLIRTAYYPGFPTDAQALMMALACICDGSSLFIETVFQNRFRHVSELLRMGANIQVEQRVAVVEGVDKLWGADVEATDLRGGAALMIAALSASGQTVIDKIDYIDRGYERPEDVLGSAGADISRV